MSQIKDNEHIVLIHASWCGHCKSLVEPSGTSIWDEFTATSPDSIHKFEENETLPEVFGVLKGLCNGYPSIFAVKVADGKIAGICNFPPIERTVKSLTDFKKDKSKKFESPKKGGWKNKKRFGKSFGKKTNKFRNHKPKKTLRKTLSKSWFRFLL